MGWFLIIHDNVGERGLELAQARYTIGRSRASDIRLFNPFVSRRHAILTQIDLPQTVPHYLLADAALSENPSANGLFLNTWRRVSVCSLQQGDVIHFGPQVYATIRDSESISDADKERLTAAFERVQALPKLSSEKSTKLTLLEPADQPTDLESIPELRPDVY